MYAKWKQYQYYVIIAVISLIALLFLPMIGSEAGLAFVLPNTVIGWVVYVSTKLIVAVINILIFHCFNLQGKVNISTNENYLAANEILLRETGDKELIPRSPKQWAAATYGKKGLAIAATSILSAVGLTQAILTFDVLTMLTYLFTIIMGIVFGILQMNNAEIYWTEEYYRYALLRQEETERLAAEKAKQAKTVVEMPTPQVHQSADDTTSAIGGSDLLVSSDSSGVDGPNN